MEGGSLEIGVDLSGKPVKQDRFIWLTTEGVTCGTDTNGVAITGYDKCKIDKTVKCSDSRKARLGVSASSSSVCIPAFTWKKI